MATSDEQTVRALSRLFSKVEAGEKGFAVTAINISNRGLKNRLKSYAQQRANFKTEILAEIQRLSPDFKPRSSLRGVIHRGRIAIFAAMAIGDEETEKVVLREAVLGEKSALQTYKRTLDSQLPAEIRGMVERQYEEVRKVSEQIELMRGVDGKRLVLRQFDSEEDAEEAVQALASAGFSEEAIERRALSETFELYEGRGTTVSETILSGAFGGSLWGSLVGALAGFGAVQVPNMGLLNTTSAPGTWASIAIFGVIAGAVIGAALGLIIGVGIRDEDIYLYDQGVDHTHIVISALVDEGRASQAWRIMAGILRKSRARSLGAST